MTGSQARPQRDAFISHASADLDPAAKIEDALEAERLDVWLDHFEIRLGVLLAGERQVAIAACRVVILLWSETAAASRWSTPGGSPRTISTASSSASSSMMPPCRSASSAPWRRRSAAASTTRPPQTT